MAFSSNRWWKFCLRSSWPSF